ncbi:MAG: pentapeptide repeat-containing protein [Myxacorys californica WJT36-NPBG1]|jgi:hypothetical protein|nr:pentapeptide repeat-containing protein [Myxacorys californica WJT36-NPBG1]
MRDRPSSWLAWLEPVAGTLVLLVVVVSIQLYWGHQQNKLRDLREHKRTLQQKIDATAESSFSKEKFGLQKDLVALEKDGIALENSINAGIVQAVGGFLLFATAYVSWKNLKATQQSVKIAAEKQVTERYVQAINHLGHDSPEIRFGGIYVLERIAKESPKDHWTVMQVLTSYVQTRALLGLEPEQASVSSAPGTKISRDIQACLSIIANRQIQQDPRYLPSDSNTRLNLIEINLCGAELRNANLNYALLLKTNLSRAYLVHANLREANLSQAILSESTLESAVLQQARLINANLSGANLAKADLRGAIGLTVAQVKSAKHWEDAIYDDAFRAKLELSGAKPLECGKSDLP